MDDVGTYGLELSPVASTEQNKGGQHEKDYHSDGSRFSFDPD